MDKKEWLNQCRILKNSIIYYDEIINQAKKFEDSRFDKNIKDAISQRDIATYELNKRYQAINQLSNSEEKIVLSLRYISGYNWKNVEKRLSDKGYPLSERKIFYLHTSGLQNLKTLQ